MPTPPLAAPALPDATTSPQPAAYDPDYLLDNIALQLKADDDAALGRMLEVSQLLLTKIRQRKMRVGSMLLLRLHELSGRSMAELRRMLGERRSPYRLAASARRHADT